MPAALPKGSWGQAYSGSIAAFGNRRTVQQGYAGYEHPNMRLLAMLGRAPEKEGKEFGYATLTSVPSYKKPEYVAPKAYKAEAEYAGCAGGDCAGCASGDCAYEPEYANDVVVASSVDIESEPRHIIPQTTTQWGTKSQYGGYGAQYATTKTGEAQEWQPLYLQPGYHSKRPSHFLW